MDSVVKSWPSEDAIARGSRWSKDASSIIWFADLGRNDDRLADVGDDCYICHEICAANIAYTSASGCGHIKDRCADCRDVVVVSGRVQSGSIALGCCSQANWEETGQCDR